MTTFRERFKTVVEALRNHPDVEVFDAGMCPPANRQHLDAAEQFLGRPLPEDIRTFYAAHDGVFLEWGLRGRDYQRVGAYSYPDYGSPPGCINLLPIAVVMSREWESSYHVNLISEEQHKRIFGHVPDDIPVGAVCFDNFHRYYHGDLLLGPEPVAIVSTDHGADMDASDWVSFSTYLDMTLALFGANRYTLGIGIGWTRDARCVENWDQHVSLDEILEKIREDEE